MSVLDLDHARRQTARTALLVQRLAHQGHWIAHTDGADRSELASLATLIDSLAGAAQTATRTIDLCLASASRLAYDPATALRATGQFELAAKWTATLDTILDTAVKIHADACALLADRVALAEEHLPTTPSDNRPRLTATILAAHARALIKTQPNR
jgi:hypothetical protein